MSTILVKSIGPGHSMMCINLCLQVDFQTGELRLSGNHTVTEYEMSGEPYSQKSGWIKHTNERIFQVINI